MPKSILVDLNVILDVLLERTGHQASRAVLELQETAGYHVFVSAHVVTTFAYLLERAKVPPAQMRNHLSWLLRTFSIVATDNTILKTAVLSKIADYEDAVIEQAAIACKASVIATRNVKDFAASTIPAVFPESLI